MAAVVALLTCAVLAASLAGPWDPPMRTESLLPWEPPMPTEFPEVAQQAPLELAPLESGDVQPWDLRWLGLVLLTVAMGWVVFLVARWLRRHPVELPPEAPDDAGLDHGDTLRGPGVVQPDLPALRAAVAGADVLVRRRVPPTDAVIAAWVHLEDAAGRSGVPRARSQTPTEFTVAVLDRTPVDPAATRTLLRLYLRARFGDEPMTAADVTTALGALATLADGLGHPEAAHLDELEIVLDPPADEGAGDGEGAPGSEGAPHGEGAPGEDGDA